VGDSAAAIPVGVSGIEIDNEYAPIYASLARAYTNIGRYQQGLANGQKAVDLDPLNADAHRAYAYALIWVGERELAIEQLEQAIALNPNFVPPILNWRSITLRSIKIQWRSPRMSACCRYKPRNERAYLAPVRGIFQGGAKQSSARLL
jgi:tetratricopeptide (TPR) repeat protein